MLQHNSLLHRYHNRSFRAVIGEWQKPEREKSQETNAVIQDVLMDWYEEAVLVAEVSPKKQHRFGREDGWLIHHCNHQTAALSPRHVLKKTKTKLE